MTDKTYRGAISVVVAAMLWGVSGVIFIPRLYNLPAFFVVFMIHFLPFCLLTVFCRKQYAYLKSFTKNDWLMFMLISVFGAIFGTLAIVKALFLVNFQHLSVVVLLQKLQPIFAILLARLLLKEKISKYFALLAAVTLCGGYFLTFGSHLPTMEKNATAIYACMLAIFAAVCFGSGTVFGKCVSGRYPPFTITFYRYAFTAVLMGVYLAATCNLNLFRQITPVNWLIFCIIVFTSGILATYLYYIGLKNVKASIATFCELSMPTTAVTLDYFVNNSVLSPVQLAGGTVMIAGIVMIIRSQPKTSDVLPKK